MRNGIERHRERPDQLNTSGISQAPGKSDHRLAQRIEDGFGVLLAKAPRPPDNASSTLRNQRIMRSSPCRFALSASGSRQGSATIFGRDESAAKWHQRPLPARVADVKSE